MIPLGSCTMKLNGTAEMMPITWPKINGIHPFAPPPQTVGYKAMIDSLEQMLCEITGFPGMSLQPNSGATGEYAGCGSYIYIYREREREIDIIYMYIYIYIYIYIYMYIHIHR